MVGEVRNNNSFPLPKPGQVAYKPYLDNANKLINFLKKIGLDLKVITSTTDNEKMCFIRKVGEYRHLVIGSIQGSQEINLDTLEKRVRESGDQQLQHEYRLFIKSCTDIAKRHEEGIVTRKTGQPFTVFGIDNSDSPYRSGFWGRTTSSHPLQHQQLAGPYHEYLEKFTLSNHIDSCGLNPNGQYPLRIWSGSPESVSFGPKLKDFTSEELNEPQENDYRYFYKDDFEHLMHQGYLVIDHPISNSQSEQNLSTKLNQADRKYTKKLEEFSKLNVQLSLIRSEMVRSRDPEIKKQKQEELNQIISKLKEKEVEVKASEKEYYNLKQEKFRENAQKKRIKDFQRLWIENHPSTISLKKDILTSRKDLEATENNIATIDEQINRLKSKKRKKGSTENDFRDRLRKHHSDKSNDREIQRLQAEKEKLISTRGALTARISTLENQLNSLPEQMIQTYGSEGYVLYFVTPGVLLLHDKQSQENIYIRENSVGNNGKEKPTLSHGEWFGPCMPGRLLEANGEIGTDQKYTVGKMRLDTNSRAILEEAVLLVTENYPLKIPGFDNAQAFVSEKLQKAIKDYAQDLPFLEKYLERIDERGFVPYIASQRVDIETYQPKSALGELVKGILLARHFALINHPEEYRQKAIIAQNEAIRNALIKLTSQDQTLAPFTEVINGLPLGKTPSHPENLKALQALMGMMLIIAQSPIRNYKFNPDETTESINTDLSLSAFNVEEMRYAKGFKEEGFTKTIPTVAEQVDYIGVDRTIGFFDDTHLSQIETTPKEHTVRKIRTFISRAIISGGSNIGLSGIITPESDDTAFDIGMSAFSSGVALGSGSLLLAGANSVPDYQTSAYGLGGTALTLATVNIIGSIFFDEYGNAYSLGDGLMDGATLGAGIAAAALLGVIIAEKADRQNSIPQISVGFGGRF